MTPLHMAAESARVNIIEHLVTKGGDIDIQDNNKVGNAKYMRLHYL